MARIAVDAYLDAVEKSRYEHAVVSINTIVLNYTDRFGESKSTRRTIINQDRSARIVRDERWARANFCANLV